MAGSLPLMQAGPSAAGAAVFDPSTIAGMLAWYKADSLVLNNNDPVSSWADSSGSGNTATQGTAANQPTYKTAQVNGKPAVSFDGGDNVGSAVSMATKPFTAFAVANPTSFAAVAAIAGSSIGGGIEWRTTSPAGAQELLKSTVASIGTSTTGLTAGSFKRVAVTYSGTGVFTFYLSGVADGTGTNDQTFVASTLTLGSRGGSENWTGLIAEFLFYNSVLSGTDRGNVETYLQGKYGV